MKEGGGVCVFCELAEAPLNEKSLVLHRGEHNYVVMNRFPYVNGHLLVIPYSHKARLKDLEGESHKEIMSLSATCMDILEKGLNAQGFNCGLNVGRVAGAGILDHFHWHIVPRWEGDSNFLPVLGGARTMPEYLSETYKRIKPLFEKL